MKLITPGIILTFLTGTLWIIVMSLTSYVFSLSANIILEMTFRQRWRYYIFVIPDTMTSVNILTLASIIILLVYLAAAAKYPDRRWDIAIRKHERHEKRNNFPGIDHYVLTYTSPEKINYSGFLHVHREIIVWLILLRQLYIYICSSRSQNCPLRLLLDHFSRGTRWWQPLFEKGCPTCPWTNGDWFRVQHNGMSPLGIIVTGGLRPWATMIPWGDIPLCCPLNQSPCV